MSLFKLLIKVFKFSRERNLVGSKWDQPLYLFLKDPKRLISLPRKARNFN